MRTVVIVDELQDLADLRNLEREQMSLVRLVNHKTGISQRKLADKFNCTHRTIGNTLKKNGIQIRKRKKASKSTPLQQERQRFRLRKMARGDFAPKNGKKIIMDDESYFTLDGVSMPGNKSYYTSDPAATPDNVKFAQVKKFPERVMIWFCISEDGPSVMHVFDKHQTMTANLYREKCLPKLVKFIEEYEYNKSEVIFWPDLATAHYAKECLEFLDENDINYVAKDDNPPNCPEVRPIENYFSILKQRVYAENWSAENRDQLIRRIKKCAKEISLQTYQSLFCNLKTKIRKASEFGLYSVK